VNVSITGRHLNVTKALESYAREKAGKLDRYFDAVQSCDVVLVSDGDRHVAEMIISARVGGKLVAQVVNSDMYAAIDLLVDKMERQLTRQKEKVKHHRKSDKVRALEQLEGEGAAEGPTGEDEK